MNILCNTCDKFVDYVGKTGMCWDCYEAQMKSNKVYVEDVKK